MSYGSYLVNKLPDFTIKKLRGVCESHRYVHDYIMQLIKLIFNHGIQATKYKMEKIKKNKYTIERNKYMLKVKLNCI